MCFLEDKATLFFFALLFPPTPIPEEESLISLPDPSSASIRSFLHDLKFPPAMLRVRILFGAQHAKKGPTIQREKQQQNHPMEKWRQLTQAARQKKKRLKDKKTDYIESIPKQNHYLWIRFSKILFLWGGDQKISLNSSVMWQAQSLRLFPIWFWLFNRS